ncbi:hypothetical protein LCGC14_0163420 [marine sediment metagenome]|uniref:Uncharacterized protein n=1 Tax=marine sediment metagenome TaxID=412755 RepID=A0A0F9XWD5_9ZZZZ
MPFPKPSNVFQILDAAPYDLMTMDHPWAQNLADRIGEEATEKVLQYMRDEGVAFEVPVSFRQILLSRVPEMVLKFLDRDGNDLIETSPDSPDWEPVRTGRWMLYIDGEPQMTLRSLEIPKLSYEHNNLLTVALTYNALVCGGKED